MNKFFYFRTASTPGEDDGGLDSISISVDKITGLSLNTATSLLIFHESGYTDVGGSAFGDQSYLNSYVQLEVENGYGKQVMKAIAAASNASPHDDGITIIADDVTKNYINRHIVGVGTMFTDFTVNLSPDVDLT